MPLLDVAFTNMTAIWHWAGKAFNVSAPTKVIVHGFGSSCSNVWVYEMRSALMDVVSVFFLLFSDGKCVRSGASGPCSPIGKTTLAWFPPSPGSFAQCTSRVPGLLFGLGHPVGSQNVVR